MASTSIVLGMNHNDVNGKIHLYYFDNYNVPIELLISDDGKFILLYSSGWEHPDLQIDYILLAGHLEKNSDKLILVDKENNVQIILNEITNDSYIVSSGFKYLLNKKFKLEESSSETSFDAIFETYRYSPNSNINKRFNKMDNRYQLKVGKYKDVFGDFCLILNSNNEYYYRIESLLISTGTWKRENGILILHDNSLNHSFTVFIQKSCLVAGLNLPGGMPELILKYQH